ncbi:hypothetical protein LK994_12945 [Ferruginibacter lapsinanis]|uniref:hypothetical protein n=1 Tax=Ferruginibacter lapsinanis TaxID=563172 RepID=UPI001E5E8351|nr:hypothetical protein [Ferruginibacter lapsinanis]UEG49541.1 hypothetical protein LK994_12945 [Ferruginibacter lapsinanis]
MKSNYFVYYPGNENEPRSISEKNETKENNEELIPQKEAAKVQNISFLQKIKNALQTWSNGDKNDEDFDNTRV